MIAPALLACAPNVAPATLQAIARVESGGNPLALNVNGVRAQPPAAKDAREAARVAESYIARGYSVDIGLMQVNSRNLTALGITVEQVLDPCTNVRAAAAILTADYAAAARHEGKRPAGLAGRAQRLQHRGFLSGFRERLRRPVLPARRRAGLGRRPPSCRSGEARTAARSAQSLHRQHHCFCPGGDECPHPMRGRTARPLLSCRTPRRTCWCPAWGWSWTPARPKPSVLSQRPR